MGFLPAILLSAALHEFFFVRTIGLERDFITNALAPIYEEIFKALILIFFFLRSKIENRVDGAVYGMSAGLGFALLENTFFIVEAPSFHIAVGLNRGIASSLLHILATGLIGLAVGWSTGQSARTGFFRIGLALIISCIAHLGFNNVIDFRSELWHIYAFNAFWLIIYAVFLFVLRREARRLRPAPDPAD